MGIPDISIQRWKVVLFAAVLMAVAGFWSYGRVGKLEDPEFTIKTALVVTPWPGGSADEVERLVSDEVERAVQQLPQLDEVRSLSRNGLSIVYVDIKESYTSGALPQIWDEVRRKVGDMQHRLPAGAGPSEVRDDFGDVYGIFVALYGDGFTARELHDHAKTIQRELLQVPAVARVELWGVQQEAIYVELARERLAALGIHPRPPQC